MNYRLLRFIGVIFMMALMVGCFGGMAPGRDASPPRPDAGIDAFLERYVQNTKNRDAEALADMHTEPSKRTDRGGTRTYTRADIKAEFDAMYAIITTVYDSYVKDVTITVSGTDTVVEFTGVQDLYSSVFGERRIDEVDITWSLQKIDGEWYIAHESFSVM